MMTRTIALLTALLASASAYAQTSGVWTGQDGNWTDPFWSSGPAYPSGGGTATIGTLGGGSITNNINGLSLSTLIFDGPLSGAVQGSTISFGGDFVLDSRNDELFFAEPLNYAPAPRLGATVVANNFTKSGPGAVLLTAAPRVSGAFNITGGTVQYYGSVFDSVGTLALSSGTLFAGDSQTAVTLSKPLTVSYNATLSGNGTYSGAISGSGNLSFTHSTGTLTAAASYLGSTTISGGGTSGLTVGGAAGRISASQRFSVGGSLVLSNTAAANPDRINNNAELDLYGGTLQLAGNASTAVNETVGIIVATAGSNTIAVTNNGAAVKLNGGFLTHINHATINLRVGGNGSSAIGTFSPSSVYGLSGGGGAAGTPTISVVPYAFETSDDPVVRLVTYSNGVLRPLDVTTEYVSSLSNANASTNFALGRTTTLNTPATVNAMLAQYIASISGTGTLTIASGCIAGAGRVGNPVNFGTAEGYICETQISGIISGSSGVAYDDGSIAITFEPNVANNYTGVTTINSGKLQLDADVRPNVAGPLGIDSSAVVLANGHSPASLGGSATNHRPLAIYAPLGTLQANAPSLADSITQAGTVNLSGSLNLKDSATISGNVAGKGRIYSSFSSPTLSGQNSYSGGTEINNSTLSLGSDLALGSGSLSITSNGTINAVGARTLANRLYLTSSGTAIGFLGSDLTFNGIVNLSAGTHTLAINNATTTFAAGAANGSLNKSGAGRLRSGAIDLTSLTVSSGTMEILTDSLVSRVGALSIATGAQLNLQNNDLIESYNTHSDPTAESIRSAITAGQLTYAASTTRRIGYGENSILKFATFDGRNIGANALLLKYTFTGDTNLDGKVDIVDLGNLAANWQQSGYWTGGDFNYDGKVDIVDLGALAGNWQAGTTGGAMSFQEALARVNLGDTSVPEPGAFAAGLVGLSLLHRKRRGS